MNDLINSINWLLETCCCSKYHIKQRKKKILTDEQIREKALIMLSKWRIDMYANNRSLYKIPQKKEMEQLDLFIKQLKIENIYL